MKAGTVRPDQQDQVRVDEVAARPESAGSMLAGKFMVDLSEEGN